MKLRVREHMAPWPGRNTTAENPNLKIGEEKYKKLLEIRGFHHLGNGENLVGKSQGGLLLQNQMNK